MQMSHSSAQKFQGCRRKFWHHKINGTPRDADASQDSYAIRFGKAAHEICEDVHHGDAEVSPEDMKKFLDHYTAEHGLNEEEDRCKLEACLTNYFELHRKSNLSAWAMEFAIGNEKFIGYVDVILIDKNGHWWITDLKTKARISHTLIQSLPEDPQLAVYGYFLDQICEQQRVEKDLFQGFRYRIMQKPANKFLKTKDYQTNLINMLKGARAYDIVVPYDEKKSRQQFEQYMKVQKFAEAHKEKEAYACNYSHCESYFTPCEFWSQCHDLSFTESARRCTVFTHDTITDQTVLTEEQIDSLF